MTTSLTPLLACIGALWLFFWFAIGVERLVERWQLGRHETKRREPVRHISPVPRAVAIPTSWRRKHW